ncbi:hypothetical protein MPTK1_2g22890 [Marchantia polymorpha subsp. ruderalis]|nr:hypothetical protein Mp_2g22890 [Marchantia polymorpha subsp. ruderalis]
MPQLRSGAERTRSTPASPGSESASLDLGPLQQALMAPRTPLVVQQNRRGLRSPTPRQQLNGKQIIRPLSALPRTPRRSPNSEGSRVVSTSKRPSTAEGSRGTPSSTTSDGKKRGNSSLPRSRAVDLGRRGSVNATRLIEFETIPSVTRLPPDLLCLCFTSIESLYYLVNCASVCRAWREALLSDTVWNPVYMRWWHLMESDGSSNGEGLDVIKSPVSPKDPPKGYDTWRDAFIGNFQKGKQKLLAQEKAQAVERGYLHPRRVTDRNGKRVFDCVQGEAMRKLTAYLGLRFQVCLNRGNPVKLQGKGKVEMFDSACILRYPATGIGSLDLAALKFIEVTTTSDKLLRGCPVLELVRLQLANWEIVSTPSRSPGPVRLLQQRISSGVSLIVGTLAEESTQVDGFSGQEQVLLLVINVHLSDLLWKLMQLGEGPSSRSARRIVGDELDPHYGLHSWHVSVQFHTFGRNIWTRHFKQVFWSPRESIPGEKAVFLLLSQHEVFPGVLKLPWKSEAFSGTLGGVYMLDFTLWDDGGEIAWQYSAAVRIDPAPLAVVEYGLEFDGERVHTLVTDDERGVSLCSNMCIPLSITQWGTTADTVVAITNLQLTLTSKFLQSWCGVANI